MLFFKYIFIFIFFLTLFYSCKSSDENIPIKDLQDPVAIDENAKITIKYFQDWELKKPIMKDQIEKAYEYFEVEFDNYDRRLKLTYWKQKQVNQIIFYIYNAENEQIKIMKSIEYYTPQMKLEKEEFLKNGEVFSYNVYKYADAEKKFIQCIERYTAKGVKHGSWEYYTQIKIESDKNPTNPNEPKKVDTKSFMTKIEDYAYGTLTKTIVYHINEAGKRLKEEFFDSNNKLVYSFNFNDEYLYCPIKPYRNTRFGTPENIKELADADRQERYLHTTGSEFNSGFEETSDKSTEAKSSKGSSGDILNTFTGGSSKNASSSKSDADLKKTEANEDDKPSALEKKPENLSKEQSTIKNADKPSKIQNSKDTESDISNKDSKEMSKKPLKKSPEN